MQESEVYRSPLRRLWSRAVWRARAPRAPSCRRPQTWRSRRAPRRTAATRTRDDRWISARTQRVQIYGCLLTSTSISWIGIGEIAGAPDESLNVRAYALRTSPMPIERVLISARLWPVCWLRAVSIDVRRSAVGNQLEFTTTFEWSTTEFGTVSKSRSL